MYCLCVVLYLNSYFFRVDCERIVSILSRQADVK